MVRVELRLIAAAVAVGIATSPSVAQEGFSRTFVGIDDDRGGQSMAGELPLRVSTPLSTLRRQGDFLAETETLPGSTEEMILRYAALYRSADNAGITELHEPNDGQTQDSGPATALRTAGLIITSLTGSNRFPSSTRGAFETARS